MLMVPIGTSEMHSSSQHRCILGKALAVWLIVAATPAASQNASETAGAADRFRCESADDSWLITGYAETKNEPNVCTFGRRSPLNPESAIYGRVSWYEGTCHFNVKITFVHEGLNARVQQGEDTALLAVDESWSANKIVLQTAGPGDASVIFFKKDWAGFSSALATG